MVEAVVACVSTSTCALRGFGDLGSATILYYVLCCNVVINIVKFDPTAH